MADLNTVKGSGRWLDGDALKSDTVDLVEVPRAILVGVAGTVKMTDNSKLATAVTMTLSAGLYPFHPKRLWSTGTTATGIVLLY